MERLHLSVGPCVRPSVHLSVDASYTILQDNFR